MDSRPQGNDRINGLRPGEKSLLLSRFVFFFGDDGDAEGRDDLGLDVERRKLEV